VTDIVITIPKSISWPEYQKELDAVADGSQKMRFKVNNWPKEAKVGDKCYVAYQGAIRGWMPIVGFWEGSFKCTTTGRTWSGKFIERSGEFNSVDPTPMKGFQGWRYLTNEDVRDRVYFSFWLNVKTGQFIDLDEMVYHLKFVMENPEAFGIQYTGKVKDIIDDYQRSKNPSILTRFFEDEDFYDFMFAHGWFRGYMSKTSGIDNYVSIVTSKDIKQARLALKKCIERFPTVQKAAVTLGANGDYHTLDREKRGSNVDEIDFFLKYGRFYDGSMMAAESTINESLLKIGTQTLYLNPTYSNILGLLAKGRQLRGIVTKQSVYVWDANDPLIHYQMAEYLEKHGYSDVEGNQYLGGMYIHGRDELPTADEWIHDPTPEIKGFDVESDTDFERISQNRVLKSWIASDRKKFTIREMQLVKLEDGYLIQKI
jgi:hypothetical protein